MENVKPTEPNDPIKPTFEMALASMVATIEADPAGPPKTDCEKADLLREALLRYIEKNCPSVL